MGRDDEVVDGDLNPAHMYRTDLKPTASPINWPPTVTRAATRQLNRSPRHPPARLMEQQIGIQDLPIELLLSIFRLSFDITTLRQDRCRLSLVCRSWRDIVQESPYLWTEISGHDKIHYTETSLAKSKDLPIDIYYLSTTGSQLPTHLTHFVYKVTPFLSRSRSISLITLSDMFHSFPRVFVALQSKPALHLESLVLKEHPSQRWGHRPGDNPLQLPEMSAFPKLRRLEIDGMPCTLSPRGLGLHNVLSLNLVDVIGVSAEQLLDVLRNSPSLESLELGRSPVTCPAHTTLTPIHLPHLTTLHLIFMPIPVSNFFLSTIHAPNCSKLSISSNFAQLPDRDVVKGSLFTTSTNHFTPILRTLLTRGRYKDIDITTSTGGKTEFLLQFHDWDRSYPASKTILRLDFGLNPTQIEETVRCLGDYLPKDVLEISIRLRMNSFEDLHVMKLLDSYTTITHLGFQLIGPSFGPIAPNHILIHMSQHTQSGWPLPNLEVFVYESLEDTEWYECQDEAMLDMLRRRHLSSSEGPDNERIRPRPIKRVRLRFSGRREAYLLGEVRKILRAVETEIVTGGATFW
ncbi:hypothetical protein FRC05_005237 [Tulasnella sp. 425]|nr:hypothetical protein FRC05_005237 [Tulasnella sp. 425]